MAKLKPCPFCGGEAVMKITPHVPVGNDFTPQCAEPSCAGRLTKKWFSIETAIYAWNRRYVPTEEVDFDYAAEDGNGN